MGKNGEGVTGYACAAIVPTPEGEKFVADFTAKYGSPPGLSITATCYDGVMMWTEAVKKVGDPDDYAAVSDAIHTMNYEGLQGTYEFAEYNDYVPLRQDTLPQPFFQVRDEDLVRCSSAVSRLRPSGPSRRGSRPDPHDAAGGRQGQRGRTQPAGPPVLELVDVGKRFGPIVALKDVSVTVREAEVLGIAGPNGSGKSTLFNVVGGVYRGTGRVLLRGENIMSLSPDRVCRRGVGRTFQIPQVFTTMTVEDNVRVGARFGGAARHRTQELIDQALEFVGLSARRRDGAGHLDLLGRKLLMLAAALATEPFLLMLDEPMGGLTPAEIGQLSGLILKLRDERRLTPIVIEHKVKTLVELSDRLMILFNGERIALGPPQEVVNDQRVIDLYLGKVIDVATC